MKESVAYKKAFQLAIKIVNFCRWLRDEKKEYELAKQLLKSGTSIGANMAEANGAISKADFSNKVSIAYKETLETKFWLELLAEVDLISESIFKELFLDADEIAKILFSIIKTTRINKQ